MHAISALDKPGDSLSYTAGRVTITLQFVREGAYTVTTYQGTYRVEDNCGSYPTEHIARSVARLYAEIAKAEAEQTPAASLAVLAEQTPAASLAVLAEQGTPAQVRPTMAGAHLADVTDPQHRALATAATLGRVQRGRGGESVATLKALARKGLVQLVMRPGKRYDVDHAVLTEVGERELSRLDAAAAEQHARAALLARHI